MRIIFRILKSVDLFGVPVKILTTDSEEKFQSIYGGMMSILISVTSLIYFIYMLNQWANGSITPNIQSSEYMIDYAEFQWNNNIFTVKLQDPTSKIDPFTQTNNIITPLLFTVVNYQIQELPQLLFSDPATAQQIGIQKGTIVLNNQNILDQTHKPMQSYMLIFAACNQAYMTINSSCASEEVIEKYLSQYHGFLSISIQLTQYNGNTQQIDTITKSAYQAISPAYPQYTQISIKQQVTLVDNGILLSNYAKHQSSNDFSIINQSIDEGYAQSLIKAFSSSKFDYPISALTVFKISIDNISVTQNIVMPKLNAVLAQIGSIVQMIFFLKYIALYINSSLIDQEQFHQIVQMYYPQLKQICIKRNILGQAKAAQYIIQEKKLEDNFITHYHQLVSIAKSKSRYINIIYEISRLQFICQQHFGIDTLQGCHELGSNNMFAQETGIDVYQMVNETFKENNNFCETIKYLLKQNT